MEAGIDANSPLDYVEFDIFPSQNRYETCVCYETKKEKVTSGLLEHLLLHSSGIKALCSKGSNAKYKLYPPENPHDIKWFTKSTLIRFLHIIGSTKILDITNSLKNEISQLEEARRFHLSLYAKGKEHRLQNAESDASCTNGIGSTTKAADLDASKNELLRALDLRLNALREELTTAFDQASGSRYSVEEMIDIEKFSQHFGSRDLSDSLQKHIELRHGAQAIENLSCKDFSGSDGAKSKEGNNHTSKPALSEMPVKYGVSPAKAAQAERQSSTESDESSLSSEEEQPSAERSRPLARSASPRRSASPMRRVQIGRSGSRRPTAITIKSLNYFPAREKTFFPKDANDSDEEFEQATKKSEANVRRMSVQDKIHLFESKQRDQTSDIQNARSLLNASIGANKSVLRRWSSGMGGDSSRCSQDTSAKDTVTEVQDNVEETREVTYSSPEYEAEPGVAQEGCPIEPCGTDAKSESPDKEACSPVIIQEEIRPTESIGANERLIASSDWSRQKEAELNELLMKMMETKPVKSRILPASGKRQSLPSEQRGGYYDHYKEKRDEKLRGEAAKKKTEKDKPFRATQVRDTKKLQPTSGNASDAGKKNNVKKIQKPLNSASQPTNPKAESPKPAFVRKVSAKASSLPSTRKSWPSMPSPGARGPSPAKTPASSTVVMSTRRKSQPTPPVSQPSPKIESSPVKAKPVKSNQNSKKVLKQATESKQQSVTKPRKATKSKVQTAPEDLVSSAKPSKVTKKSSVVPVESKPFLRKGSKTAPSVNPPVKKKASSPQEPLRKSEDLTLTNESPTVPKSCDLVVEHKETEIGEFKIQTGTEYETLSPARSPQPCESPCVNPPVKKKASSPQEPLRKSEDLTLTNESPTVPKSCDLVVEHKETEIGEFKIQTGTEYETLSPARSPQPCEDKEEGLSKVNPTAGNDAYRIEEPELEAEAEEESTISPTAWVEIEEHEDHSITSGEPSCPIVRSPVHKAPVGASSPRVRHSLSQMLLEESSEPDVIDWGNAENPPAMVYHKDAPKGLKRLLKFARKSKPEGNASGWSSPSFFSEGEDDAEDTKSLNKRSSENLLRIATLQSMNNGHQKISTDFEHPAQANIRKLNAQSLSQQLQEGNISASATTTKATRSFFSLSAFKGSR